MIDLEGVTKVYQTDFGPNVVLREITAHFPPLSNVGILGLNGAGKSTLLRVLAGTELPDSGRVTRRGRVSWPIGFTGGFQGSLTGEEGCRFVARLYGVDEDEVVEFARDFARIGAYFFMPVKTYSTGMRARLGFALSMAIDFDVYLVDEVTAVGDRLFQERCRLAFAERRSHASTIMVSHNFATIRQYCDRCSILADGQLLEFETVEAAAEAYEAIA